MAAATGAASRVPRSCWPARSIRARASPSTAAQIGDGYVLLCVARPLSDCTLEVGVESHDKLYRNPFQSPLRPDELKPDMRSRRGCAARTAS